MSKKKKHTKQPKLLPRPPLRFTARRFKTRKPLLSVVWVEGTRVKINRYSRREVVVGWEVNVPPNREGVTAYYEAVRITSESPIAIELNSAGRRHTDKDRK